mmetsp:Transcript_21453/g.46788  ORF Transcript_21453/g.46788 Transcript_21453/m.46788 type:complete len:100 (-) Transcript_21453:254-553(-)|eukprot:CAMPEP_0178521586 /NCGR_PEP_ID=MMETSP0696-20121128/28032_1 /TAXON_ID=265572 /ORGANISM="Extubocellulus spinifer, Strain CCMP396" /LENGTH=99 /DNA_ID=CAMNT_0020152551 /DNA_START=38 /DNA_END=337 /DNA_ORIENTATION=+
MAEEAGAETEQLTIRIKDGNGEETQFKIKKATKMGKVFKAYAERKGISQSSLRFLLDGDRVQDDQTAKMLELEDGDQIDAVLEQVGGSVVVPSPSTVQI